MAAVKSILDQTDYTLAEQGLQNHIFETFGTRENELDLFRINMLRYLEAVPTFRSTATQAGIYRGSDTKESSSKDEEPTLADQHKVGFFSLDRASQTDVTEVVDLKEMTEVIQILLQDVATLRRDINFAKHVMQADYESKLQERAYELYCRINEKVLDLEKTHEDSYLPQERFHEKCEKRVTTVRRAFRQQLSDAIARVAVLYNKNLQSKINKEKNKRAGEQSKMDEQWNEMKATIMRNEQVISMLKLQLQQYQQPKPAELESITPSEDMSAPTPSTPLSPKSKQKTKKKTKPQTPSPVSSASTGKSKSPPPQSPSPPPIPQFHSPSPRPSPKPSPKPTQHLMPPVEELSIKSKSPEFNPELEELRETVVDMEKKIDKLTDTIQRKADENNDLSQEIKLLNEQTEKDKIAMEKLRSENEKMLMNAEQEMASSKKMAEEMNSGMERQKAEMERMMKDQLKQAKEEALLDAKDEAERIQNAEKDKLKLLMDQRKLLEEQLLREKKKNAEKSKEDVDAEKMKKHEQKLRDEIERLKKEIERVHRTWEKKFAILQQSLHALKDESYVRQTLQRQAAALHHAAVSYAADTPVGITPSNRSYPQPVMRKPVIPDIPNKKSPVAPGPSQADRSNPGDKDYISYTVSAPSGRGTAMMSVDENQVMSDGDQQDIPDDTEVLPEPPMSRKRSRQKHQDEGSRHSSQSHVVVVPSQAS